MTRNEQRGSSPPLMPFSSIKTQKIIDAFPDQLALLSEDGVIIATNRAWKNFAVENGADANVGVGKPYLSAAPSEADLVSAPIRSILKGEQQEFEHEYACHSETTKRWFMMRAVALDGGGVMILHTNITSRKLAELEARTLAELDVLTGVRNRLGLRVGLDKMRHTNPDGKVCAILIDCDDFKSINDTFGHVTGDGILLEVANSILNELRQSDLVARIGGDEFLVIVPNASADVGVAVADRIRFRNDQKHISTSRGPASVRLSVGVSSIDLVDASVGTILRQCGGALAQSKSQGKNQVSTQSHIATPSFSVSGIRDQLRVARQPIVSLHTDESGACELLVRGPKGPLASPLSLFSEASNAGYLYELDFACLNVCVSALSKIDDAKVHINIYAPTLMNFDLADVISRIPNDKHICFELNEKDTLPQLADVRSRMDKLRSPQVSFGIDDVGFGHSSIESLIFLEPETIKIDQSAVFGISRDAQLAHRLKRMLSMFKGVASQLVLEGIEDEDDRKAALNSGATCAQGYLWGKPELIKL